MSIFDTIGKAISDFAVGNGSDPGYMNMGLYKVDPRAGEIDSYDDYQAKLKSGPVFDRTRPDQFRDQQLALAGNLMGVMNGSAPSVAQEQLRQGAQANLAATVAGANSLRGPSGAANAGQLLAQQAAQTQALSGQQALLRANEVAQARSQLGQVLDSGRGQDQQEAQAEQALTLQYIQAGLGAAEAQQQARMQMEALKSQNYYRTAENRYKTGKDILNGIGGLVSRFAGGPGGAIAGGAVGAPVAP